MASTEFPRLLVVAAFPPSAPGGGAAVTRQVLRGWPEHSIRWWCPYPQARELRGGILSWPATPAMLFPRERLRRTKTKLAQLFWTPLAAAHLRKKIADFAPGFIWCIPHEWSIPAANAVLPRGKTPYAVYIQDYPTTDQLVEIVGAKTAARWMQNVENLVRRAAFVDTTSYPMGADIARRTGRASTQMLHEGLECTDFERLSRQSARRDGSHFTLAFVGTVVAEQALAEAVSTLGRKRQSLEKPLRIEFYSPHTYARRPWFDPEWMTECGYKDRDGLITALQHCQAGLVVMDTDGSNSDYNRFSFPTKFITYLAAGIEPVVVSHESSAVAALVRESGIGLHFGEAGSLAAAMPDLMRASVNRGDNQRKIAGFARHHFDAAEKRNRFRKRVFEATGYA